MIKATFTKDNKRCHLIINGHANYKERELTDKFDIVCGMVSVLAQSAIAGCKEFCKGVESIVDNGHIEIHYSRQNVSANIIVETCFMGIEQVKHKYPQCFK